MPPTRRHVPAACLALALLLAGCRGDRADRTDPEATVGSVAAAGSAPAGPAASATVREPDDCRACHAREVELFERSGHRLATRRLPAVQPPEAAKLTPDAPVAPLAREVLSLRPAEGGGAELLIAAGGGSEARQRTHVLGGLRREDFLSPLPGGLHVLPVAWSITRGSWVHPVAEEIGGLPQAGSPVEWTAPRRAHEGACSRCHPLPEANESHGINCKTCHGDAAAHVATKSGKADAATWTRDDLRRQVQDPWRGCAWCHAGASERPLHSLAGAASPFTEALFPQTFAGPGGLDRQFRMDGTPAVAHGLEVQSLATSPCHLKGEATCTTCHDPHGGPGFSLRDADPDASCRKCHATLAADHAKHPLATSPVPSSLQEPAGPAPTRLPGCVDCHAPALLPFGKGDLARDHAISIPRPALDSRAGILDACAACHPGWTPAKLEASLPPSRGLRARERRLAAFGMATGAKDEAGARRAVAALTELVKDTAQDPWTRASAAHLAGAGGPDAASAAEALHAAWTSSTDPALVAAAANAEARVGGPVAPLKERLASEKDWRIRIAIAGGLASRGEQAGADALEAIYSDTSLPEIARADAGSDLAVLLIGNGSCRRAASVLADALNRNPDSVPSWLNLGVARACLGDRPGARAAFGRVLELQPDHELARRNLASLDEAEKAGATAP